MRRESAFQVAVVATLVGVMMLLLGGGVDAAEQQRPTSTSNTWRPATPDERRQYELDRLFDAVDQRARLNDILDRQTCRQTCRP